VGVEFSMVSVSNTDDLKLDCKVRGNEFPLTWILVSYLQLWKFLL